MAFDVREHLFRAPAAHLAALHIDDGAERTVERTAPAGVDGAHAFHEPPLVGGVWGGQRSVLERGRGLDAIDRLQVAGRGVLQNARKHARPVDLALHEGDAGVEQAPQFRGGRVEELEHAADMESADQHLGAEFPEAERQVRSACKHV